MLAYMFWRTAAQMRRDRVLNQREATRGKYAFTPLHRARSFLRQAFRVEQDDPQWNSELCSSLDRAFRDRI